MHSKKHKNKKKNERSRRVKSGILGAPGFEGMGILEEGGVLGGHAETGALGATGGADADLAAKSFSTEMPSSCKMAAMSFVFNPQLLGTFFWQRLCTFSLQARCHIIDPQTCGHVEMPVW